MVMYVDYVYVVCGCAWSCMWTMYVVRVCAWMCVVMYVDYVCSACVCVDVRGHVCGLCM